MLNDVPSALSEILVTSIIALSGLLLRNDVAADRLYANAPLIGRSEAGDSARYSIGVGGAVAMRGILAVWTFSRLDRIHAEPMAILSDLTPTKLKAMHSNFTECYKKRKRRKCSSATSL